jgi:hypothetical protein
LEYSQLPECLLPARSLASQFGFVPFLSLYLIRIIF